MTPEAAGEIARDGLIWLAGRPDAFARFMAETGADPGSLRALASDASALGFVLDFLLADEALLRDFAAETGLDPAAPWRARQALPGGGLPNWT